MTTERDSARKLSEEILEGARQESSGIVDRARQEAEALLAGARAEADRVRGEILERSRAEALRRRELVLASVPVEAGRLRVARIESLLEAVREEARTALAARQGFEYRDALVGLAACAISHMEAGAFLVKVSEVDRAVLGNGLVDEIAARVQRPASEVTLIFDHDITEGGVIVEDARAGQVWDNRLLARFERIWPELRWQVALGASFVPRTESGGDSQ